MTFISALAESFSVPFSFVRSLISILRDRKLLSLCIVPYGTGLVVFFLSLALAWHYNDALANLLSSPNQKFWHALASALGFFVCLLLSALAASVSALIAGSFTLEALVAEALTRRGLRSRMQAGLILPLLKNGLAEAACLALAALLWLLGLLLSFIPIVAWIPPLLACFLVGFALLGLPFSVLCISTRERLKVLRGRILPVIALGALVCLIGAIPLVGVLLAPAFQHSAAELTARWLNQN